jgi:hypothetical protein
MVNGQQEIAMVTKLLPVLLLSGCAFVTPFTVIDTHSEPPKGWPELTEIVINDYWQARKNCGGVLSSCSVVNFCTMTNTIYTGIKPGTDLYELMLEHEREHGKGRDHVGEYSYSKYFAAWKPWLDSGTKPTNCARVA